MFKTLGKATKIAVLSIWFVFTIFPLYWMALTSIRPVREVTKKLYYPHSNSTLDMKYLKQFQIY